MNILKRVGLGLSLWALVLVGLAPMGCGDSNGGGGGGGGGVVAIDPVGNYAVTDFTVTSTTNSNNVLDGDTQGLYLYFALNSDKTLTGKVQTPQFPPMSTDLSGTWSSGDNNALTLVIVVDGQNITISGTLSQTGSAEPVFEGSQTGGDPIQFGDNSEMFEITNFDAVHYENTLTNEDVAGSYVTTEAFAISNLDGGDRIDLLGPGDSQSLVLNADGTLTVSITDNGNPDNIEGTYHLADDFHIVIEFDDGTQTLPIRVFNDVLTVYNYDASETFPPASTKVSATQILVFSQQ